jgi:hypothetical protein
VKTWQEWFEEIAEIPAAKFEDSGAKAEGSM